MKLQQSQWLLPRRSFLRLSGLATLCSALGISIPIVYADDTPMKTNTVILKPSDWLTSSGNGVEVYSNDGNYGSNLADIMKVNIGTASNPNNVTSGYRWQCVELVNRLYLTKGWITSTWSGYGNTMYANAPSTLKKASDSGIDSVNPGDVICLDGGINFGTSQNPVYYGHVAIVDGLGSTTTSNGVVTTTVNVVSQNISATVSRSVFVWDQTNKKIKTDQSNLGAGYSTIGIVHAPSTSSPVQTSDNTVLAVKKLTQSDGTNEVFWCKGTNTFETWWRGNSGPQTSSLVYISQGDIKAIDAQLLPDGLHLIYTATTNYIWQTAWYPGQTPSTGLLLHSPGNIRAIQKTIGPDGVTHQMYVLTDNGVSEYWWNSTSNGIQGGSLYTLTNPVAMYKTLEPDGTQVVYIADSNYAYMVRWGGSVGGLQVSTITNISNITAISFSEDSDGKHRLYVGSSSGGIWEISWYVPGSYSTWYMVGGAPVVTLQKWESDSTQVLYEATSGGVFEYYWSQTSNASLAGDTIVGSLSSVHAFVRTTDPNSVQSVYTATGTNVLETWWIPGGNGPTTGTVE